MNTNYRGSAVTRKLVAEQIAARYGQEEVKNYDPVSNCRTYKSWLEEGYQVKKGEKALRSVTMIELKNDVGEVIRTYPKRVNLFYQRQVERITV